MPLLSKTAISQYFRTECQRQLRFTLYPDNESYRAQREAQGMPAPQPPRPGLHHIRREGEDWQAEKLGDLTEALGAAALVGSPKALPDGRTLYVAEPLRDLLGRAVPGTFLVEAQYEVTSAFEDALFIAGHRAGLGLRYSDVRPDLVQVLPARTSVEGIRADGSRTVLPPEDGRLQLRVIDIKLASEPSVGYFGEVVYYMLTLAAWLQQNGLDNRFVVVPDGAVWPGSHEASALASARREAAAEGTALTTQQLMDVLEGDLEFLGGAFDVLAIRLRRFLQDEVPPVLAEADWRSLPWHVGNRCQSCEYLGEPRLDAQGRPTELPDHCLPMAERDGHLSRVAFVSRGATLSLKEAGIADVPSLAQCEPDHVAFDGHQALRATRTVVAGRARSLGSGSAGLPPNGGTSALMPGWADLRIYLDVHFDVGSAITFALGIKAFWVEPWVAGHGAGGRATHAWRDQVFVVDGKDVERERRELLAFLDHLQRILADARGRNTGTTYQVYLWDRLAYEHLTRIVGRHLDSILQDGNLQQLAWLFPPEELLPNPTLTVRRSPVTIVGDVAKAVLAAPVPHYYTLLNVARHYHDAGLPDNLAGFSTHPHFETALSDQVPSERAHEIWSHSSRPNWSEQVATLRETVVKRLRALESVTKRLERDLRAHLVQHAPPISIGPPTRQNRVSDDGQLWHAYTKLNQALEELDVQQIRAMPAHEREARFRSARLIARLTGAGELEALQAMGLSARPGRRVYRLRHGSREVKFREGDFSCALAPESDPTFLDRTLSSVALGSPPDPGDGSGDRTLMGDVTAVAVVGIDRDNAAIALDPNTRWPQGLDDLERFGRANLTTEVTLDPVQHDYFSRKLLAALQGIGNPQVAVAAAAVRRAVGLTGRGARPAPMSPAAEVLWTAADLHRSPVARELPAARAELVASGLDLNPAQWDAWSQALTRRLQLIWGPPGTGKSRTAQAIVLGAAYEALRTGRPFRILVCAFTYRATDNVLLGVNAKAPGLLAGDVEVHRLRSYRSPVDASVPASIDRPVNQRNPSQELLALHARLLASRGVTIVGGTADQVHNLMLAGSGSAVEGLFDLVLIDEASQMDVAHAAVALCSLATGGAVVLAGDSKQLPPIHKAEPPKGLEDHVGSVYTYCELRHGVPSVMLDLNYRSNATLVGFSLRAGYRRELSAYSPDLELDLVSALPAEAPADWPPTLFWTREWAAFLDPGRPACCFLYDENRSSQWNRFEADAVASLVALLHGNVGGQLLNERDPRTGNVLPTDSAACSSEYFWQSGIGVVTPHRAQQGLIVGRLQGIFAPRGVAAQTIRDAVDTVERFQGQQRDVIIASFALGDPDAIRDEEQFLMSLNRFNVMASRARAKLIVLVSRQVIDHLAGDAEILRGSALLKLYAESFCGHRRGMRLGWVSDGEDTLVEGTFGWAP